MNWVRPLRIIRRDRGDYELRDAKDALVIGGTERQCREKLAELLDYDRRCARDATLRRAINA